MRNKELKCICIIKVTYVVSVQSWYFREVIVMLMKSLAPWGNACYCTVLFLYIVVSHQLGEEGFVVQRSNYQCQVCVVNWSFKFASPRGIHVEGKTKVKIPTVVLIFPSDQTAVSTNVPVCVQVFPAAVYICVTYTHSYEQTVHLFAGSSPLLWAKNPLLFHTS